MSVTSTMTRASEPLLSTEFSALQRLSRTVFFRLLGGLRVGEIVLHEGSRRFVFGDATRGSAMRASIRVNDPRFYPEVVFNGSVGAGRAYMRGWWDGSDLTMLVRLFVRNTAVLERWRTGAGALMEPVRRAFHALRRNTPGGSRRNIAEHYDLSNEFFSLFLDDTMMYSSAVFERPDMSLKEASTAKLDRICRKLRLTSRDHLLEIGTGWGGLAVHAAERYGCRVTTTTISREQYDYASRLVAVRGLEDRVTLLLEDYRSLTGTYDKLVSVEMIEAVGADYLDTYFATCSSLLADHGMMLLQAIVIDDREYDRAARSVDFIKRYIFPGSCIPSMNRISRATTRNTDLRPVHLDDLTRDYAETLRHWRERLRARREDALALGLDEEFLRRWDFYFSYCEGGFRERRIGDVQLLLAKPGCEAPPFRGYGEEPAA